MDPNTLPDDVLHAIFRECDGASVLRCRRVCHRWLEAVDALSDRNWMTVCNRDPLHDEYQYATARSKYGLCWRDSYRSINSWRCIGSLELLPPRLLCDEVQRFDVLPNGIVSCLQCKRNESLYLDDTYSDTVVYYDIITFLECGRQDCSFPFLTAYFSENEHLKVFYVRDRSIRVIINKTKQYFTIGSYDSNFEAPPFSVWLNKCTVIENKVYFKDGNDILYVSKLMNDNDNLYMETAPLGAFLENEKAFNEDIVTFTVNAESEDSIFILTDEENQCSYYVHNGTNLCKSTLITYDLLDIFIELQELGFNWKSPAIYDWLQMKVIFNLVPVFCSYGNIYVTTSQCRKIINIYYSLEYITCPEILMDIFRGKPQRSISIMELLPQDITIQEKDIVSQLNIIDTATSHILLVKVGHYVFTLNFLFNKSKNEKAATRTNKEK